MPDALTREVENGLRLVMLVGMILGCGITLLMRPAAACSTVSVQAVPDRALSANPLRWEGR